MASLKNSKIGAENKELAGRYRIPPKIPRIISIIFGTAGITATVIYLFSIGIVYWGEKLPEIAYLHLILSLFLPLVFLYFPISKNNINIIPWYDYLISITTFLILFYFCLHGRDIMFNSWEINPPSVVVYLGLLLWVIVLEGIRRTVGYPLFLIVLVFSLYPLFAEYMPSILFAKSFGLKRLIAYHSVGPESIIGLPTKVVATLFVGFLVFGVALTYTGASKFFLNLSLSILGTVRGGPAKVAIVSSSMIGSISGSVATNIITTGTITIPAMIRAGYPPYLAAAIESCSSTGGVIMPPIMGAVAFVMAAFIGIPYYNVVIAAIVPSILFYFGLFIQVDGFAAKNNLIGISRSNLPKFSQTIIEGWFYLFAFAVLVFYLFFERLEAQAPYIATFPLLMLAQVRRDTRLGLKNIIAYLEKCSQVIAEIIAILAGIGLLIGSIVLTGLAQTLSSGLIELAGGNVILLVLFGGIASFILGMGLTTTACYLLLAILLAPALEALGLNIMAVHLFMLYCGMLSYITPPVAIASFIAASLVGAPAMKTAIHSCKLGVILFLLPFFFIFNPGLVLQLSVFQNLFSVATALFAVFLISSSVEGYFVLLGAITLWKRIYLSLAGFLLFLPYLNTSIIGFIMAISLYVYLYKKRKFFLI